eukprot:379659_1
MYELKKLSQIKVIGTVLLENFPQLLCQALYAYAINEITDGVQLAFIASLLSVTASTLSYLIDRDTSDTVVQYYLITERNQSLRDDDDEKEDEEGNESIKPLESVFSRGGLTEEERENIMNHRGR